MGRTLKSRELREEDPATHRARVMSQWEAASHCYQVALYGDTEVHLEWHHRIRPSIPLGASEAEDWAARSLTIVAHLHAHGRG